MKKTQALKTLADYRRAAQDSLFSRGLPPESKSASPYDAINIALEHTEVLISCSRAAILESLWSGSDYSSTEYKMGNLPLFYCVKLMEFAIAYRGQSIDTLFPNWPRSPVAITVFTSAGMSSLEAAFDFVRAVGGDIIRALQNAYLSRTHRGGTLRYDLLKWLDDNPKVDDLKIYPVTDAIVKEWFEGIVHKMQRRFPEREFSNSKVETEFNSTHKQLEYEWNNRTPKNLMTSTLIVKHFKVSPATLRRYVKDEDKKLTDYREKPHSKNAMLILDAVEVARYFDRKP